MKNKNEVENIVRQILREKHNEICCKQMYFVRSIVSNESKIDKMEKKFVAMIIIKRINNLNKLRIIFVEDILLLPL